MKTLARMAFVIVSFLGLVLIGTAIADWEFIKTQINVGNPVPLFTADLQLFGGWICLLIAWFGMRTTYRN